MKRNLVNFTRGSQLLGRFGFMFAAGLRGPLIVAALTLLGTCWWTLARGLSDHETYLVWMRSYAAIYTFMEFDPAKQAVLETTFGTTVQIPMNEVASFSPAARAWANMMGLLQSALTRSALFLVPGFVLFYWFAAHFGGRSKERKHERGAMLATLPELVDELTAHTSGERARCRCARVEMEYARDKMLSAKGKPVQWNLCRRKTATQVARTAPLLRGSQPRAEQADAGGPGEELRPGDAQVAPARVPAAV